jgi:hypothetical protein
VLAKGLAATLECVHSKPLPPSNRLWTACSLIGIVAVSVERHAAGRSVQPNQDVVGSQPTKARRLQRSAVLPSSGT